MKKIIFSMPFLLLLLLGSHAIGQPVQTLPAGRYTIKTKPGQDAWKIGNIQLKTDGTYSVSSNSEQGEYKFSAAGQRVFFTSGPLKGTYATTRLERNVVAIVFPSSEPQPFLISEDVVALWSQ